MLSWLRGLLSAGRRREASAQGGGQPRRDGGAVKIETERIDAARRRLREEIPPSAESESEA